MDNINYTIKKITLKTSSLEIFWGDNHQSKFHFLWLRDNCPSSFHPDTRMRKFNLLNVSENIHPKKTIINDTGDLIVMWSEGGHQSIFTSKWLRDNCYTLKNKYISPYNLWDSSIQKKNEFFKD